MHLPITVTGQLELTVTPDTCGVTASRNIICQERLLIPSFFHDLRLACMQTPAMTPNSTRPESTETTPLLGKPDQNRQLVDPGDGIAPAGPEPYEDTNVEDNDDENDLERQTTNGSNFKHQGLPEVRKQMKYIFPAIAIGVSIHHLL